MRISLVISSMGAGGAERVMSVMANYWVEHGHEVTLVTLASVDDDFYDLNLGIRRIGLSVMGGSPNFAAAAQSNVRRVRRLREAIRESKPHVVLSFIDRTNVLTLIGTVGLSIPIIACEHIDPRQHATGAIWKFLRYIFYPRAAAVVVLTEGVRGWAEKFVRADAVHVIPNPVTVLPAGDDGDLKFKGSGCTIVAMGRLTPQKGFDFLLKAFAICSRNSPNWSLVILGEGEERSRLESLIDELGLKDRVRLPGRVTNPASFLRMADLFVLSSRYEGFPMALVEAMACGLPVISTDCPSGPREIIRNGIDGILVQPYQVDALALAMSRLIENPDERKRIGSRAMEVVERFSVNKVMTVWDDLFIKVYDSKARTWHPTSAA